MRAGDAARFVVLFSFGLGAAVAAPHSPENALKSFQHEPDVRVELVAAEPLVASPCALAFDERGRLFVAENRAYPNTVTPPQGTIAMLEDADADGRMDKRVVFADGLTFPNGVLPWQGGVLVTCAPDLLFLKDTDGDGRADERRVVLTGFATSGSTQLRVNTPTLGPDGWIYLASGLSGGEITSPEHPQKPALKMTGDLRWQPRTGEFENVDGRSQYGMSFDDFGRRFICMNRVPVQHVVLSSKVLARNPHLAFSETVQDCSERTVKSGLRSGESGVRLFPISSNITTADSHAGSFSAACGIHIWRGGALPETYRGCAFTCDPTANLVHADKLVPRGATFSAEPLLEGREFLASRDDWFRPVFLASGPDGALYIADMYRKVIEHPDYLPEEVRKRTDFESGKEMGRIWRVVAKDAPANRRLPKAGATPADVVPHLSDPSSWLRDTAFRLLLDADTAAAVPVLKSQLSAKAEPHVTAWVLRLLHAHNALNAEALDAKAIRGGIGAAEVDETLAQLLPAERARSAVFGLSFIDGGIPVFEKPRIRPAARAEFVSAIIGGPSRVQAAIVFGQLRDEKATRALAFLSIGGSDDRWFRAAVLSGVAGRERDYLKALFAEGGAELPPGGELLYELGKLLGATTGADAFATTAEELIRLSETVEFSKTLSLLSGFASRTPERFREPFPRLVEDALVQAVRVLAAPSDAPELRAHAATLLGRTDFARGGAPLVAALTATDAPPPVQLAAAQALAGFDEPDSADALLDPARWKAYAPTVRPAVLDALLARPVHVPSVLAAAEASVLNASAFTSSHRQAFLKSKDAAIRERAEKLFGAAVSGGRKQAFENAKAALALKANAAHGREVFRTACATCHRLEREGFGVGPDLFEIRNQPKENILFHIVVPDAEVASPFSGYLAETKDGRTLSGVLAAETPTSILLRMPGGAEETLLRTNIAKLEALPGSLMPPGLEAAMTQQDLADLLAFLKGEAP